MTSMNQCLKATRPEVSVRPRLSYGDYPHALQPSKIIPREKEKKLNQQ
jgi:hypothetical protein